MFFSFIRFISPLGLGAVTVLFANNLLASEGEGLPAESTSTELEAITVSASKINEDLQTTSTSVTVITADDIERKGLETLDDIAKVIPNTASGSIYTGVTDWNYRGLNTSVFKGNNPVIVYVDGVAQVDRLSMFVDMENVERIEVVRGPSGTVHGKGAIGGAINIITKQPTNTLAGEVSLEAGEHGKYEVHGIVSGPLIKDKLLGKLVLGKRENEGNLPYADKSVSADNIDQESSENYTAQLDFFPDEFSSLRIQINHNESESGYGRNDVVPLAEINSAPAPDSVDHNTKTWRTDESDSQLLKYERDFSELRLETQLNHRETEYEGLYECDFGSAVNLACTNNASIDNRDAEIRLVSDTGRVKWVSGFFFGQEEKNIHDIGYYFDGVAISRASGTHEEETRALFGQTIAPVTDKLEITAGIRLQQQSYDTDTRYIGAEGTSFGQGSEDEEAVLPKLGLSYQLDNNNALFASYSKGVLSGGFNELQSNPSSGDAAGAYFKPQYNDSFEVGYKGYFKALRLSASVFYMDIEDIHTYVTGPTLNFVAGNLKGAESSGMELELRYAFNPHWSLDTVLGYTDAEYKSGSVSNGQDVSGNTVEKTPEFSSLVGINYNLGPWYSRLETHYQGSYYFDHLNSKQVDSAYEINARAGWRQGKLELFVYGRNLTDETNVTTVFDISSLAGPGMVNRGLNQPRTLGAGLSYSF